MTAVFSNYRVVGGGIQIRNLQPPTSATGRVIVAPVPLCGTVPGPSVLGINAMVNANAAFVIAGVQATSNTSGIPSDILELP